MNREKLWGLLKENWPKIVLSILLLTLVLFNQMSIDEAQKTVEELRPIVDMVEELLGGLEDIEAQGVTNFDQMKLRSGAGVVLTADQRGTYDIVQFQDGGTTVWQIGDGGVMTFTGTLTNQGKIFIDGQANEVQLTVQGYTTQTANTFVVETSAGTDLFWVENTGDMELNGTTPRFTIGDAGAEDTTILFDGIAQDYYIALDDTADDFLLGLGSVVGTTGIVFLDENQDVGLGGASAGAKLDVTGNVVVDGGIDEEQLVVQGHSTQTNLTFVVETSAGADQFSVGNTGIGTLAGLANLNGGIAVDTSAFTVADTSGNMVVGGTSDLQGNIQDSGGDLTIVDNVLIDGAADEEQLVVQGSATQTNLTFVVETSAGADQFSVGNTGIGILAGLANLNGGIAVDTNAFTVADVSGNTVIAGTTDQQGNVADSAGTWTVADDVLIDGQADAVQLIVQMNATQTSDGVVFEDSDGTDWATYRPWQGAGTSSDLVTFRDAAGIMDGDDTTRGIVLNLTGENATGTGNVLSAIEATLTTADPQVTENAIVVNDLDWDYSIAAGDVPIISTAQTWMEDFFGGTIAAELVLLTGTDPQGNAPVLAQAQFGTIAMLSGDDGANCAADCSELTLGLHWAAEQASLIFETRLYIDTALTNAIVCAGFSDKITLEMPATIAGGDAITTNAADAAVFCFDDAADTDEWFAITVAGTTDGTGIGATGVAPVFDTYQDLRIELDAGGADARFYINGALVKTITANAITVGDLLSPVIVVDTNAAAGVQITVDYVFVSSQRR